MAYEQIPEPGKPVHLGEFLLASHRYPAVYFLFNRGRMVYVGQSTTLDWRIDAHLQQGLKTFDAVAFLQCPVDRLLEIESYYIRRLAPEYNRCSIAMKAREQSAWRRPRKPRWTAQQRNEVSRAKT